MKAKTCIKKSLSLIIVLVMLLTMIPVGIFSTSAAEATIDLSQYETTTEFVINNTTDWELIAASDYDFAGKTVKLGADIDASGYKTVLNPERFDPLDGSNMPARPDAKKPTSGIEKCRDEYAATFYTLFKTFAGTFDGQGHTIKNARVEEALIAAKSLHGAKIQNVVIENVQCCDFVDYRNYGIVVGEATGSLTLDRITLIDGYVPANTFNSVHFNCGGGLVGFANAAEGVEGAMLTIMNCKVDAEVNAGGEHTAQAEPPRGTGIVVGTVHTNFNFMMVDCEISGKVASYSPYEGAIGMLNVGENRIAFIKNIKIDNVDITGTNPSHTHGVKSVGALIGIISPFSNSSTTISKVNVTNAKLLSRSGNTGGVIGSIQSIDPEKASNLQIAAKPVVGASIEISQIYSDAIVISEDTTGAKGAEKDLASTVKYIHAAGFIAQVGESDSSGQQHGRIFRGDIKFHDLYITGTVIAYQFVRANPDKGIEKDTIVGYFDGAGGLFGSISAPTAEVYVSDAIIDVSFPYNKLFVNREDFPAEMTDKDFGLEQAACVGVFSASAHTRSAASDNIPGFGAADEIDTKYKPGADGLYDFYIHSNDIVTTVQGDFYVIPHNNRYGGAHYNGQDICCRKGNNVAYTDDQIASVRPAEARKMVTYDANGFVEVVSGAVAAPLTNPIQAATSQADATKLDLRFIGLAYVASVKSAKAVIEVYDGDDLVKTFTFTDIALFDELTAVDNTAIAAFTTNDLGAKKYMAATIKGVPTDKNYTFKCTFEYVTAGDKTVTGNVITGALENGALK